MRPMLLLAMLLATLGSGPSAQSAQGDPAVTEVRQTLTEARKAIETYRSTGGAPGVADDPAIKWEAALWAYRERYPRTDAAALASAEAVRLLVGAELWDRAHARVDSLAADDPAWVRLPSVIYDEGIARKDLPYTIDRLTRAAATATNARIKSSAQVVLGRAYRRQGDTDAAIRSLEAAKSTAPDTPYAEEADGLIYEIRFLSVGLQAPPVSGKPRKGRPVNLASFRGKPVVLVFWGTT